MFSKPSIDLTYSENKASRMHMYIYIYIYDARHIFLGSEGRISGLRHLVHGS